MNSSTCYCVIDPGIFQAKKSNWEEIFEIPGMSNITLMGNDSLQTIKTCQILLASLGTKFESLLEQSTIELNYPFTIVSTLHEFSLSGEIDCNRTNIEPLLRAAKEFNVDGIRMLGGRYLVSLVNAENVTKIYQLSQELLCLHFTNQIKNFMLANFQDLSQTGNFLKECSRDLMELLLKDDELNVTEENLVSILLSWAKISPENALDLAGLLNHIRFGLVSETFFNTKVKSNELLQSNTRLPNQFVLSIGGYTNEPVAQIEVLEIRKQKWYTLPGPGFPTHAYHDIQMIGGNDVFVFGGFGNGEDGPEFFVDTFHLDLLTNFWTKKSSMDFPRCYLSTAVLNGEIFCIGGFDGFSRSKTAEKYHPDTNQWTQVKIYLCLSKVRK